MNKNLKKQNFWIYDDPETLFLANFELQIMRFDSNGFFQVDKPKLPIKISLIYMPKS